MRDPAMNTAKNTAARRLGGMAVAGGAAPPPFLATHARIS